MSLIGSVYHGVTARKAAEKWLARGENHHNHKNATKSAHSSEYVSMDEFALVDNFRIICFLGFVMSLLIIKIGKKSLRASWKLSYRMSHKVLKCSIFKLVLIGLICLGIKSYVKESIGIVKRHNGQHQKPHHGGHHLNKTHKAHAHKKTGPRHLA